MNANFPPLPMAAPTVKSRRRQKLPFFPVAVELLKNRLLISQHVRGLIAPVARTLHGLTPEQRKAVFLKLESDRVITQQDLAGTALRIMATSAQNEILAVPREQDLQSFEDVVRNFGEAPLKKGQSPVSAKLVGSLQNFGLGDPKDRLSVELRSQYARLTRAKSVIFEVEIVTFENGSKKQKAHLQSNVEKLRAALGNGANGGIYECDYGESGVRICLWATGGAFKQLVEGSQWQQVIGVFESRPHFEPFHSVLSDFKIDSLGAFHSPDADAPTICVIDTGVAPGNPFLKPVVRQDLCRSYLPGRPNDLWDENGHGSGIASLASYYVLSPTKGAIHTAQAWIASARILNAQGYMDDVHSDDPNEARNREARLLSSVLREVVRDFKPHGIRIFVFSFNVLNRIWNKDGQRLIPRASWLARTIDRISLEEDVVFLTITGNLDKLAIRDLHKAAPYPKYFNDDEVHVQDPGQAAMAITVGSIAHSATVTNAATAPLALVGQPSPFTRTGPGLSGAIKPDMVERGGNSVFDPGMKTIVANLPTEVVMASHKLTPPIRLDSGTSYAAPRVAHHLSLIQHDLYRLGIANPSAPLQRALLANCCSFKELSRFPWFKENFDKKDWLNLVGYGMPSGANALTCDEYSPILYADGKILPDKVALFDLPLPVELADTTTEKRISVSVAFAPPIQQFGLQSYLGVTLKFRLFPGDVSATNVAKAMSLEDGEENLVREQEEDMAGAFIGMNKRSRGTLQHDVFKISNYQRKWSAHPFTLAIALTQKWGGTTKPVAVAVVVKIQDVKHGFNRLYASVAESLVRARTRVRAKS